MWLPILLTVIAASGNNIGKVLQKQATRQLPKLSFRPEVLQLYLASRLWVLGTVADLSGAVLMIAAFAQAPVSVVQPVSAVGLAILLIFSHFYLKEQLRSSEWLAAAVAFLGVLGLGVSAEPGHLDPPDHLHPLRIVAVFLAMVAALVLECWWRHTASPHSSHGPGFNHKAGGPGGAVGMHAAHGSASSGSGSFPAAGPGGGVPGSPAAAAAALDAMVCGLEGGACFGLSAAACRTGFILARRVTWVCAPTGLAASVVLTSSGFVLQTRGLKAGSTVVVCTMAAVASMATGVLAGLLALGEALPSSPGMRLTRLASWMAILLGVSCLAGGPGGLGTVGRVVAALITSQVAQPPSWVWRFVPRPISQWLHKAGKRLDAAAAAHRESVTGLPVSTLPPGGGNSLTHSSCSQGL